jgi:hypothetical protein
VVVYSLGSSNLSSSTARLIFSFCSISICWILFSNCKRCCFSSSKALGNSVEEI